MIKAIQSDIFVRLYYTGVIPKMAINGQGEINLPKKPETVSKTVDQKLLSFIEDQNLCAQEAG